MANICDWRDENSTVVGVLDGTWAWYRILGGRLEVRHSDDRSWSVVPPEDILQHLMLDSPVGAWLRDRMLLKPAPNIEPYKQVWIGGVVVRDPVCGIEIDEINVPESLQSEEHGRMYYFCSPECRLEFEQNRERFINAA